MTVQVIESAAVEARRLIRSNEWRGVTSGVAPGHVQANLAILPRDLAFDFLLFCQRNPRPCPLLEVIEAGSVEPGSDRSRSRYPYRRRRIPGVPQR